MWNVSCDITAGSKGIDGLPANYSIIVGWEEYWGLLFCLIYINSCSLYSKVISPTTLSPVWLKNTLSSPLGGLRPCWQEIPLTAGTLNRDLNTSGKFRSGPTLWLLVGILRLRYHPGGVAIMQTLFLSLCGKGFYPSINPLYQRNSAHFVRTSQESVAIGQADSRDFISKMWTQRAFETGFSEGSML